ncbi:MAG: hypothetical protein BGO65_16445 [Afipia sp. 64-13]|nr:MAG: hypothetical protein BGO65_16445 [Afipia sp. 64-13]
MRRVSSGARKKAFAVVTGQRVRWVPWLAARSAQAWAVWSAAFAAWSVLPAAIGTGIIGGTIITVAITEN